MKSLLILGLYVVPAALLFGLTFVVLHIRKRTVLLRFEYVAWLLPGLVYWLIPILIYEARWYVDVEVPPKTLANLPEPVVLAVLYWVVFVVRVVFAGRSVEKNVAAAYWCIAAGVGMAIATVFLVPPLPE